MGTTSRRCATRPSEPTRAAQQLPEPSVHVEWIPHQDANRTDRGTGIVFLARKPGSGRARADTVLLRGHPDLAAPVVGAFIYTETAPGRAWSYAIVAPRRLRPNVLEFAYEEAGLPLDSVTADRSWGRALLGLARDGGMFRGWVQLDSTRVQHLFWSEELPRHPLFLWPGASATLFDRPGGRALSRAAGPGNAGYIMHPRETRGPWMRVRLVRPSDLCGGEDLASDTTTGWLRYLDDRGRPIVWYHTRGC